MCATNIGQILKLLAGERLTHNWPKSSVLSHQTNLT